VRQSREVFSIKKLNLTVEARAAQNAAHFSL
jgi:hypothetical protein